MSSLSTKTSHSTSTSSVSPTLTPTSTSTSASGKSPIITPLSNTSLSTTPCDINNYRTVDDNSINSETTSMSKPGTSFLSNLTTQTRTNFSESKIPHFVTQLTAELQESITHHSDRSMLPTKTLITSRQETGRYLVIDLGGSTLKICIIELMSGSRYEIIEGPFKFEIPNDSKTVDLAFFNMIAEKVSVVLNGSDWFTEGAEVHTGVSWSFPFDQTEPNNGFIYVVSKGYVLTDEVKGCDLSSLFADQFNKLPLSQNKKRYRVLVNSIINDAVAVFNSGLYLHDCAMGLVVGTGLNASFQYNHRVINAELSFFGSFLHDLFLPQLDLTMAPDLALVGDQMKLHVYDSCPLLQPLEYLIAGRYIGELFRLGAVQMIEHGELFSGCDAITGDSCGSTAYDLDGAFVGNFSAGGYEFDCELVKRQFGDHVELSLDDYHKLKQLIEVLINRASLLLCVAIFGIIKFLADEDPSLLSRDVINVGYVGSMLEYFTLFKDGTDALLNKWHEKLGLPVVKLVHIDNSSILGAGVSAGSFDEQVLGQGRRKSVL
ncbi:unnamed protein product [Ambrosiozyma monospora]|uniref:Phosphotransferase n=1 Tax=Ambrosiozyma monospora TaxID=43982 RepID=A0A9W7DF35_AMBMO|nr:unnamed protein product [Ambrosiozyma monospora]